MSTQQNHVKDLPWYETLRTVLEPYRPADSDQDAEVYLSSPEIIASIESHHGVPQGPIGKEIQQLVGPEDFVRAMQYLGFKAANAGGVQLQWLLKRK